MCLALRPPASRFAGSLDHFEAVKVTPHIGLEFCDLKLDELNDQQHRVPWAHFAGVVFLRNHDLLDPRFLLEFGRKIATPPGFLHIHPLTPKQELSEILVITNEGSRDPQYTDTPASDSWHSDFTFEKSPSSYAALQLERIPETGGDTLWASGYAAYDRLSKPLQAFLETLSAEHDGTQFHQYAKAFGVKIHAQRGADNVGEDLKTVHPVIRTNPVTGWKSLFVNKRFTKWIVGPSKLESDVIFLFDHIAGGFDFQVRFKWNVGDIAIWDNRPVLRSETKDFDNSILRR